MTAVEFSQKWDNRFRDNDTFLIAPSDLRAFKDDLLAVFGLQGVNVPLYSPTKTYDAGYLVRWTVAGQKEAFYYALQNGKLPAPTGATDLNWKVVPGPVAAAALSQELTLLAAQSIEGAAVVAGRTYLIDFGPDASGHAQVVTLLGTAANLFAIRGQLTVNGVRRNVRVNVASGVFGEEVSNLLDTANTWKERQVFLKGLGLYNGAGFDEYGQLTVGQLLLADKFLWRGSIQKMANDVLIGWSPDDYAGQGNGNDIGLARAGAGLLEVNTGTAGQPAELVVKNVRATDAPAAFDTIPKLAAGLAAVSNQTLFNYVPLKASTIENYVTASYFGSLYELSFGTGIDPSATNLNVWLPVVSSTNVKQSVVVRLLASEVGKTVSIYGRPAATAAGDRVLLQQLKPGDSAAFTVLSAYGSPYVGYGVTFSTVLPATSGGGASTFAQLTGQPRDNADLARELNAVLSLSDGRHQLITSSGTRFNDLLLETRVTLSDLKRGPNVQAVAGQVLQGGTVAVSAPRQGSPADVVAALNADIAALADYRLYLVRFQTTPTVSTDVAHALLTVTP